MKLPKNFKTTYDQNKDIKTQSEPDAIYQNRQAELKQQVALSHLVLKKH